MICIHPTLMARPCTLQMLQFKTGARVELGNSFFRLVSAGKPKADSQPTKKQPNFFSGPVILECNYCAIKSNMLLRNETCTSCKVGRMIDPWNGGNAA